MIVLKVLTFWGKGVMLDTLMLWNKVVFKMCKLKSIQWKLWDLWQWSGLLFEQIAELRGSYAVNAMCHNSMVIVGLESPFVRRAQWWCWDWIKILVLRFVLGLVKVEWFIRANDGIQNKKSVLGFHCYTPVFLVPVFCHKSIQFFHS